MQVFVGAWSPYPLLNAVFAFNGCYVAYELRNGPLLLRRSSRVADRQNTPSGYDRKIGKNCVRAWNSSSIAGLGPSWYTEAAKS